MTLEREIEQVVLPVLSAAGLELVDVQFRPEEIGWVLRFFIDKPGGFGLTDCQEWSDRLGQVVDECGLVSRSYSLEVSSPGLARPLKKQEDFERFKGIDAFIKTSAPIGTQRNFHGRIEGLDGDRLVLLDRTSGLVRIPLSDIASAKLDPVILRG
ncbi:MAG: ribosome maturation factor RimP [Elusimicrobia bacterium]|nr:ribosome maturation factor RimP [Elusimicrobiota bacterium]MBP9128347.1 ribosome maturation factor RimP [Elusimicrobiota bacterium]MBP9698508.1 ribosome maturation factor RimP [Elusimicrobiota bacterium]